MVQQYAIKNDNNMRRRCNNHKREPGLLLLCAALTLASAGEPVRLSLTDTGFQYDASHAPMGIQFEDGGVLAADLMLPPEADIDLCSSLSYPPSGETVKGHYYPIALLVAPGDCTTQQQAETAILLRQSQEQSLRYLIFQSTDTKNPNIVPDAVQQLSGLHLDLDLDDMGFLFVSYHSGESLLEAIMKPSFATDTSPLLGGLGSPFLGGLGNDHWRLPITISAGDGDEVDDFKPMDAALTYITFLGVLFLSIGIPLFAGCYESCRGGGRLVVNREGGRVRFELVRPGLLSRSEVLALPEIAYHAMITGEDECAPTLTAAVYQEPVDAATKITDNAEEVAHQLTGSLHSVPLGCPDDGETPESIPASIDNGDLVNLTTTCSICSICIQDFEEGERIRVLPLCHHAYHIECIMPWLTERHGQCPMCKARVLAPRQRNRRDTDRSRGNEQLEASCHDTLDHPV